MNKHLAKIYASIAYVLAFVMTVLNIEPSYSQLAGTFSDWLLYGFLIFVILAHLKRGEELDKLIAIMFFGVGVFSVNSPYKIVENLHLIFTGLAILVAYLGLIKRSEKGMFRVSAYASIIIAPFLFVFGFIFHLYTVAVAELLVSTPLIINFYKK